MPTNVADLGYKALIWGPYDEGTIKHSTVEQFKRLADGNVYLKFVDGSEYITHMSNVLIYKD